MGVQKQVFTEYVGWADTVAFSPDDTTLASGCGESFDQTVAVVGCQKGRTDAAVDWTYKRDSERSVQPG